MNTHNTELPPLPGPQVPLIDADIDLMDIRRLASWCEDTAKGYARDAIEAERSKRIAALEARHEEAMTKYDKTKESYHEGYADALHVAIHIISGGLWK